MESPVDDDLEQAIELARDDLRRARSEIDQKLDEAIRADAAAQHRGVEISAFEKSIETSKVELAVLERRAYPDSWFRRDRIIAALGLSMMVVGTAFSALLLLAFLRLVFR